MHSAKTLQNLGSGIESDTMELWILHSAPPCPQWQSMCDEKVFRKNLSIYFYRANAIGESILAIQSNDCDGAEGKYLSFRVRRDENSALWMQAFMLWCYAWREMQRTVAKWINVLKCTANSAFPLNVQTPQKWMVPQEDVRCHWMLHLPLQTHLFSLS